MPFLSPVGSAEPSIEIRSSKTLLGSAAAKCDVVLPRDHGVLDLHALLSLSDDHASATLVPFAVTSDGACFLNGRLVPREGVTVVHGDRMALGNANNAYVFSLTDRPNGQRTQPVMTPSLQTSRSFRRTLDALRGDRVTTKPTMPALGVSASRERLENFLLDASTDSLLGDFVERKLRRSSSSSVTRKARTQRPAAMEPPPSLSMSTISSLRSSLNDSILEPSGDKQQTGNHIHEDPLLGQSKAFLSTAERNYAEIEKLRLSQRLREVNNVLNGHLGFGSSYLSIERRSSGAASMRISSPVKLEPKEVLDEDIEEESTEELPTLVEKPPKKLTCEQAPSVSSPHHSVKSSIASMLSKHLQNNPHEDSLGNTEDVDAPVDESLPSFSEAIHKSQARPGNTCEVLQDSSPPTTMIAPIDTLSKAPRIRPQLHQQLIDRTLRRKRHEVLTAAFHRWRRGLRLQQQRRREKTKQFQLSEKKLLQLRRNHSFWRWKRWTECKHQVLECREESFVQRQQIRLIRRVWKQWMISTVQAKYQRRLLRRCVACIQHSQLRGGLQRWKAQAQQTRLEIQQQVLLNHHESEMQRRMQVVAQRHHETHVATRYLVRIFRAWHSVASQAVKKNSVLSRLLLTGTRRRQLCAWNTWKQNTAMSRQVEEMDKQRQIELIKTTQMAAQQLEVREQELRNLHDDQLRELQTKLQKQAQVVQAFENEKRQVKKQLADQRATAKMQWASVSEALLKKFMTEVDSLIVVVSGRLEAFLQQMDEAPEAARFQAASFLVETMLEQKIRHANEHVQAREVMPMTPVPIDHNGVPVPVKAGKGSLKTMLTNNGHTLLEMLQQRYMRLHQLHQAIAKLGATVVDPPATGHPRIDVVKFKHAVFLTDTMHDRTLQHLDDILSIHHRRCHIPSDVEREARKY